MPKEMLYKYVGDNVNVEHLSMLPTTWKAMRGGKLMKPTAHF